MLADREGFFGRVRYVHNWNCVGRIPVAQVIQNFRLAGGIEGGQWFVEQQHRGIGHQRSRKRDALTLAAGNLTRLAPKQVRDSKRFEHRHHSLRDVPRRAASRARIERSARPSYGETVRDSETRIPTDAPAPACRCWNSNRRALRAPRVIRPASGRTNPAMQFSRVVFPQPDGPSSIVKPADVSNSASSVKAFESRRVTCTERSPLPVALSPDAMFPQLASAASARPSRLGG